MLNFIVRILMDKAGEPAPGGAPHLPPPPIPPPPVKAATFPPKIEEDGDDIDDLGYKKATSKAETKKEPGKEDPKASGEKEDPVTKPEDIKGNLTGYEENAPVVDEPEPPKNDPPPPPPTDLEKKLEGLHKSFADKIKDQVGRIQKKGLPAEKEKEMIDELIADKKQEQVDAQAWGERQQKENELAVKKQKANWHKELKEDPDFGGANFLTNVSRGAKVLDEYLPELKKELTDNRQMLRPSVMKGLARLADALYRDDKLVQGDQVEAQKAAEEKEKEDDPLAFYTN